MTSIFPSTCNQVKNSPINICWFSRDIRLEDNAGLFHALSSGLPVLPVFIFDEDILNELERHDKRVCFIHAAISQMQKELVIHGTSLHVFHGKPLVIFRQLLEQYSIQNVFVNHDYEPYAIKRDLAVKELLSSYNTGYYSFRDQVIFEKNEVVKPDGSYYSVFTPYSKKWKSLLTADSLRAFPSERLPQHYFQHQPVRLPTLEEIGFISSRDLPQMNMNEDIITNYHNTRNLPAVNGTSRIGVHLRFGTISIRKVTARAIQLNEVFLNELIWREFFMQMLWHEPRLEYECFKTSYENIEWRNNEDEFQRWCEGCTGYPIVDAGMRELNETGFMHNRVRMIVASFLVKHLLIDWRWGEAYFAKQLLDYELASNLGNWQWVAGCGCDAAPYFRIFSPEAQTKKFDPKGEYIRKWVPEVEDLNYCRPIVDHAYARERCLRVYKKALERKA